MPPLDEVQRDPALSGLWRDYSTYDAQATWELYHALEARLRSRSWTGGLSLMDFYRTYWRPFAECLTDLERVGMYVDVATRLPAAERAATADRAAAEATFLCVLWREWGGCGTNLTCVSSPWGCAGRGRRSLATTWRA